MNKKFAISNLSSSRLTKSEIGFIVLVVALSLFLFWNILPGGLVLDDHSVIEGRSDLLHPASVFKLFLAPWHVGSPWAGNWRPLTLISYLLEFTISQSTWLLHLVNILLYASNIILLYFLVKEFASREAAYLSSLIFLFLPIHVEPVASIVSRTYLLGLLFALLCLRQYYRKKYLVSAVFLAGALLSSDFMIALAPLLGLLMVWRYWGGYRQTVRFYGLYFLPVLIAYFGLRYLALGKYAIGGHGYISPVTGPLAYVSLVERISTGLLYLSLYLKNTFYPLELSPDYSFDQIPTVSNILYSPGALAGLMVLVVLAVIWWRGKPELKNAVLIFSVPYVIMSNMFFISTGTFADRFWYVPSVGIAILLALGIQRILAYQRWRVAVYLGLGLVAVWYSVCIVRQNRIWLSDSSLYTFAAQASPRSAWARSNLASLYIQQKKYVQARQEAQTALSIYPPDPGALNTLGKLDWQDRRYGEAEQDFLKALEADPYQRNHRSLYRSLAFLNLEWGKYSHASQYMEQALKYSISRERQDIEKKDRAFAATFQQIEARATKLSQTDLTTIRQLAAAIRGF